MNIPDRPLYKFLSVDKHLTPSWQDRLSALLTGQCYLSSAADFNDPFDCYPYLETPSTPQERDEWVEYMVPMIVDSVRQHIPADYALPLALNMIDGMSDEQLVAGMQKASLEMAAGMGVFCLAECLESVLMWSHYASNHQGIALRFEFDPNPETVPIFWKVTYQDDRPALRHTDFNVQSYAIAKAMATKASFWTYEQEWRIMLTDHARTTLEFDPKTITGIILGAKCSDEVVNHATTVASLHGLQVMRMIPDQRTFELKSYDI